jgi:large subunit ribosomal protein L3
LQLKDKAKVTAMKPGQQLTASEIFQEGALIDIAGTTIGKGFQGETS